MFLLIKIEVETRAESWEVLFTLHEMGEQFWRENYYFPTFREAGEGGGEGSVSSTKQKVLYGKAPPRGPIHTLFVYHFDRNGFIEKVTPFTYLTTLIPQPVKHG